MSSNIVPAGSNQAVSPVQGIENGQEGQYLTFSLANELYGIDILKVQEIRGWSEPTQIPNAPEFIRGVMNLRGEIVPILDLRRRFGMEETEFTKYTVVIVMNVKDRTIGMIVDAVSDVMNLDEENLRPAPDFGTTIDSSFIRGLAPSEENMIIMLNIDGLLASCELVGLDKLSASQSASEQTPQSDA